MPDIEAIVREINRDFVPQFEERLGQYLAAQDREWLIEQIVRLSLDAHSPEEMDRRHFRDEDTRRRFARAQRVTQLHLDAAKLAAFLQRYRGSDRQRLITEGMPDAGAPPKGGRLIEPGLRSEEGNQLLEHAKDVLYGLVFGDAETRTTFDRTQRELLTLTVPRLKSEALDFMKATTELSAMGTWQDPRGAANDMRANNIVLEKEFGEMERELIGDGVVVALSLIDNLEINEEILYGRMENIEQSTLFA